MNPEQNTVSQLRDQRTVELEQARARAKAVRTRREVAESNLREARALVGNIDARTSAIRATLQDAIAGAEGAEGTVEGLEKRVGLSGVSGSQVIQPLLTFGNSTSELAVEHHSLCEQEKEGRVPHGTAFKFYREKLRPKPAQGEASQNGGPTSGTGIVNKSWGEQLKERQS